jgi:ketosteroid isomerase-like protein
MSTADATTLTAENGIRRTLAEYCLLVDDGDFDGWAGLFSPDAVLKGNGDRLAEGRDAIRRWIAESVPSRSGGKHLTLNSIIHQSAGVAEVTSDFFYLAPSNDGPVVAAAGRYLDRLIRQDDRWRFAMRDILLTPEWVRYSVWAGKS